MDQFLILAQSTITADALRTWLEAYEPEKDVDISKKQQIVWTRRVEGGGFVDAFQAITRQIENWIENYQNVPSLNRLTVLVDTVRPSRMNLIDEGGDWDSLIAIFIICFPELHWKFGLVSQTTDETGAKPENDDIILDENGVFDEHRLKSLYSPTRREPLFDPTGLRFWIRNQTNITIQIQKQSDFYLPVRLKLAAALDDEPQYAYFHAYTSYRFGFRADVIMTWQEMKICFDCSEDGTNQSRKNISEDSTHSHPYWLLLEDMSLNFPDKPNDVHLLDLITTPDPDNPEKVGRPGYCKQLDSADSEAERSEYRVIVTAGQSNRHDATVRSNKEYIRKKKKIHGRGEWVSKPAGGVFDLWKKARLYRLYKPPLRCRLLSMRFCGFRVIFHPVKWCLNHELAYYYESADDGYSGYAPGYWPLRPTVPTKSLGWWSRTKLALNKVTCLLRLHRFCKTRIKDASDLDGNRLAEDSGGYRSHGSPGKLLLAAEKLIGRAVALKGNVRSVSDAVLGATYASEALEITGGRTPTAAIEALSLKHQFELLAECQFSGVEHHLAMEPRISELTREIDLISHWFGEDHREKASLNAKAEVLNELVRILREHNQFDEELRCMQEVRRVNSKLWYMSLPLVKYKFIPYRLLGTFFYFSRRYIENLVSSSGALLKAVVCWLLIFTVLFTLFPSGTSSVAGCNGWLEWLELTFPTFAAYLPEDLNPNLGCIECWITGLENAISAMLSPGEPLQRLKATEDEISKVRFGLILGAMLWSVLHLGILISHLYTLVSRR